MELIRRTVRPIAILVAAIWAVEIVNFLLGHGLTGWGILPRSVPGLVGIPLAPLLHASFGHAASNTVPLIVLGGLTAAAGDGRFWSRTVMITLLSGALVWLFARSAYHVGASGLIFGYFGFLLARAIIERSIVTIAVAVVTIAVYGSILWGVLPLQSHVSFEGHLFGLIAGLAVARFDRRSGRFG